MDMSEIIENLGDLTGVIAQYGSKLLLAILVLALGWQLIRRLLKILDRMMDKNDVEATLQRFLLSFTSIVLKVVLLIIFASMVGVETTSLIALLGAAGLAVGLALQGSLANFAGGVIVLFFKPFKVGDVIEVQGFTGMVEQVQIFSTMLKTYDNQVVFIPNGVLSNGCIKNIFMEPTRRVDLTFGISYGDDIGKARDVIQGVIDKNEKILKDPVADILVSGHGDSSVDFTVRPWTKSEFYWDVHFYMLEQVKLAFDEAGISIPFPQRDVHLIPTDSQAVPTDTHAIRTNV